MSEFNRYPIELRPLSVEDGGGWLASLPDLPGCMADGLTPEQAIHELADAATSWIDTARVHGDGIPEPGSAALSGRMTLQLPRSLKARLQAKARAEGVSLDTLVVSELAAVAAR